MNNSPVHLLGRLVRGFVGLLSFPSNTGPFKERANMSAIKRIEVDADEAGAIMRAISNLLMNMKRGFSNYRHGGRNETRQYLCKIWDKYSAIHDSLMSAPVVLDNPNRK